MNYHIIESVNVTPKPTLEEAENGDVRKVEEVIVIFDGQEPDSHEIAYDVFRDAKYVIPMASHFIKSMKKTIAKYRITYPSASERFEEMVYGCDDY